MGGEGGVSEGSGGAIDFGAAGAVPGAKAGCGGSLTGDQFSSINLVADLWWLLVSLALLASLRCVAVRISHRK